MSELASRPGKTVVAAGDRYAGGILTQEGADAVNANHLAILQGRKPTLIARLLDALYKIPGIKPNEISDAETALKKTQW